MKTLTARFILTLIVGSVGCSDEPSVPSTKKLVREELVIDPSTFQPQICTGSTDPACDEQGAGQRKACDVDNQCRLYLADDNCSYPDSNPIQCVYIPCGGDGDCDDMNPDPVGRTSECVFTTTSFLSDPGGICAWWYNHCEVMPSTPCQSTGVTYLASNGDYVCSAQADMEAASPETCDMVDNDCDGAVDETFTTLASACDGSDTDSCKMGTYTCTADGLSTECVNESVMNFTEACNGQDDDCDGAVDETFTTLASACDGSDTDSCKMGTYTCTADGLSTECVNESVMNFTEACNGQDDDCDGAVDETFTTLASACDGSDTDSCKMGTYTCTADGLSTECVNESAMNLTETCNSVDDNCDGLTDENFLLGVPCTVGIGVCMTSGTFVCQPDGMSSGCSAVGDLTQASPESCNGLDDDCDGQTDEACDDDNDDWCDAGMDYSVGADRAQGDCDDTDAASNPSGSETCNGVDDNCNGVFDDACDDDNDGFCDVGIAFVEGATCLSGDCNDTNSAVHPGVEEACLTTDDDNCDGDTVHKADGVTPACDSCASATKLACGVETIINLGEQPNGFDSIDTYNCMTNVGSKTIGKTLSAPEAILVPDAPTGTVFSFTIKSTGLGAYAALLHGSCEPDVGTSGVTAFKAGSAEFEGTCAAYGITSVKGGVVGEHFVSLDAPSALTLTVKFTCNAP